MLKKTITLLLSIIFITCSVSANTVYYRDDSPIAVMGGADENEKVTYIVELEGGGLLEKKQTQFSGVNYASFETQAIDNIRSVQDEAISQAQYIAGDEVEIRYTHIMNGFSIAGDLELKEKLEKIDGVKSVSVEQTFYFEATDTSSSVDTPDYSKQDELIGLSEEIRENYTGEGIVIGVIDSEFRHEHVAFQTEPSVQTLTEENIITALENNELVAEVNLKKKLRDSLGEEATEEELAEMLYNNGKMPFMFDYACTDTDTSISQSLLHGTHVAAIAAGNSDKFKGVAPDAQLVLMKVSEDNKSGAGESVIYAALDDLVKLGVDVINMSMGDKAGFIVSERYNSIFSAMEQEGIVVSMSAGNAFRFGDNRLTLGTMAEHPDYGLVSTPASYNYPTAVASKNTTMENDEEKMSEFSSWGATSDLRLKPEITALGGTIISAGRDGKYAYLSGTSMAAPQYAGAAGVVLEYLRENMSYSKPLRQETAQKLLASSALIEYDDSLPVSPRKQGAGVINLDRAIDVATILYSGTKTKIELGEIENVKEFSFDIQNISPQKATYRFESIIMTDAYEQNESGINLVAAGRLLENSTLSFKEDSSTITTLDINGYGKKTVKATLTLDEDEAMELSGVFKNGFFVEGYIIATETATNKEVSIPFMGFHRGEEASWNDAPLYHGNNMNPKPGYVSFTSMYSVKGGAIYPLNYTTNPEVLFYSTNDNAELMFFSDNIRNIRRLNVKIIDSQSRVVSTHNKNYISKNDKIYRLNTQNSIEIEMNANNRMTLSNSETKLPDGMYTVEYTGISESDGTSEQGGSFKLYVDSVYPVIADAYYTIIGNKAYMYVRGSDDVITPRVTVYDSTGNPKQREKIENGYYIFDMTGYDLTSCTIKVDDAAGNASVYSVKNAKGYAAAYKEKALSRVKMFDALVMGGKILNKIAFEPEENETIRFFAWDSNLTPLTK